MRTERIIERLINRLKTGEIVGRVGPAKGGHWEEAWFRHWSGSPPHNFEEGQRLLRTVNNQ
jgi:hypothetical protein